jgi:alcohol dehydrogenase
MSPDAWEFHNPTRITFGAGAIDRLPTVARGRALLVTSQGHTKRGTTERIRALYPDPISVHDQVRSNPTISALVGTTNAAREANPDVVIALGGGSVIDSAKVARLAVMDPTFDVRTAVAGGYGFAGAAVPLVAIPTTAGTGSEVTPTATIWDDTTHRKHSLADGSLFPSSAIVDPELAVNLGWHSTLSPGLDAFVQCFESIWNVNASPVPTELAARGIGLIPDALRSLRLDPTDTGSRGAMAEGALLSGLAISQTRTALAHSLSYPVTAHLGLAHGLACALFLPAVLKFNLDSDDGRMQLLRADGSGDDPLESVLSLFAELEVASAIREEIGARPDLRSLADEMLTTDRSRNNLRPVEREDVRDIVASTERWLAGDAE